MPGKGTREETEVQKQKMKLESAECTMGSPETRQHKTKQNIRPKAITSNTKQVMQGDG
jgi:hypothetical protein